MKDLKQGFSRWYNKSRGRRGFFCGEWFKSVLLEEGETRIQCLAYIDLNAVRAGIVGRPEEYRWCSLGYHLQADNAGGFLSLDFGLRSFAECSSDEERLSPTDRASSAYCRDAGERRTRYRRYVYEIGSQPSAKGARIDEAIVEKEEKKGFRVGGINRLLLRTRYFTDSGILGTKELVSRHYRRFEDHFTCRHEKRPRPIAGLDGVYSLKRLAEAAP